MPELPEVETIKRDLNRSIRGAVIRDVSVIDRRVVRNVSVQGFCRALKGKAVRAVIRRGKALVVELAPGGRALVVQLMMTGQLVVSDKDERVKATKLVFALSNGRYLLYNDQRLFGRLQIVRDLREIKYFCVLGKEPLSSGFSFLWLEENLQNRARPLKTLLLDHTFVAGIGNIYASEILFTAGLDPRREARGLRKSEIRALHRSTVAVLQKAIRFRGTSMNTYRDASGRKGNFFGQIRVYGRDGENCFQCRKQIQRVVMAGRSTFFCQHCQK